MGESLGVSSSCKGTGPPGSGPCPSGVTYPKPPHCVSETALGDQGSSCDFGGPWRPSASPHSLPPYMRPEDPVTLLSLPSGKAVPTSVFNRGLRPPLSAQSLLPSHVDGPRGSLTDRRWQGGLIPADWACRGLVLPGPPPGGLPGPQPCSGRAPGGHRGGERPQACRGPPWSREWLQRLEQSAAGFRPSVSWGGRQGTARSWSGPPLTLGALTG